MLRRIGLAGLFVFIIVGAICTALNQAGAPDCVVKFRVDRQEGSLSMINEVRPEVRVEILDCGSHLKIKEGGIP